MTNEYASLSNQQLLEKYCIVAGQSALAQSFHQPRKEKQYDRELLKLEAELLKRMEK